MYIISREYTVLASSGGTTNHQVTICNVSYCSCPEFEKNGKQLTCKHDNNHILVCYGI